MRGTVIKRGKLWSTSGATWRASGCAKRRSAWPPGWTDTGFVFCRPNGGPIHPEQRLGHATVGITLDTYSHVSATMQAEAAAKVASLVLGDG